MNSDYSLYRRCTNENSHDWNRGNLSRLACHFIIGSSDDVGWLDFALLQHLVQALLPGSVLAER